MNSRVDAMHEGWITTRTERPATLPATGSVAIIDWLGQGGIAQTSEAWMAALEAAGSTRDVSLLTRTGREIPVSDQLLVAAPRSGPLQGLRHHMAVTAAIVQWLELHRPATVVIQNFLVPVLERRVHAASRRVGAKVILVMHNDRAHSRASGVNGGLRELVTSADVVVCHSAYVAERICSRWPGVDPQVIPHPLPVGLLAHDRPPVVLGDDPRPVALQLGVLKRNYKGTDLTAQLVASEPSWRFVLTGNGAPQTPGAVRLPGFRPPGELAAIVQSSDAVLLPYRHASQSGVIVLAQALGAVPVAHAVGGIPEQIEHGATGILLAPGSPVEVWREALSSLVDPNERSRLASTAGASIVAAHDRFVATVRALT